MPCAPPAIFWKARGFRVCLFSNGNRGIGVSVTPCAIHRQLGTLYRRKANMMNDDMKMYQNDDEAYVAAMNYFEGLL